MTQSRHISRRSLLQAGAIGSLGLSLPQLARIQAEDAVKAAGGQAKSVLFIFLSGGLSQLDSFDMKPEGPSAYRGEFRPVASSAPGIEVCEHLPHFAKRMHHFTLVRSMTHWCNEHNESHTLMLTGRSKLPPGYNVKKPQPTDWPSIAATTGRLVPSRSESLPASMVVPQRLLNMNQSGVVIPGQFAGQMGSRHDPWFVEASPYRGNDVKGAYPDFAYRRLDGKESRRQIEIPGAGPFASGGTHRIPVESSSRNARRDRSSASRSGSALRHEAIAEVSGCCGFFADRPQSAAPPSTWSKRTRKPRGGMAAIFSAGRC